MPAPFYRFKCRRCEDTGVILMERVVREAVPSGIRVRRVEEAFRCDCVAGANRTGLLPAPRDWR